MTHGARRTTLAHPKTAKAAALCNQTPAASDAPLWLGVDLGTCDVVSMVVDGNAQPVAVCLDWADVVRDGIVWDFFGAVTLVRRHLDTLEQQLGCRFTHAATSFPPGTDPRISINVLESAGLEVSHVLDEPTAVADLLALDNAGVVDIGGGTTGIAIVKQGKVTYSADEATGGHHISLTLAGNRRIPGRGGTVQAQQRAGDLAGSEAGVRKDGGNRRLPYCRAGSDRFMAGGRFLYAAGRGGVISPAFPGVTGAFTAAQPVYDPAGDSQQRESESGGTLCKLNYRRRCFRHSTP